MKKFATMTGLYSVSHFIVDFSCAYLIFSKLSGSNKWLLCLIIYNFFAFALQMPIGIIADKINRNRIFAALGCLLVAGSPAIISSPVIFCAVAGFGNALFHIGAGRDILQVSEKSFSALGIFVSPGALGLYFGTLCGKGVILPVAPVIIILASVSATIWFVVPKLSEMHVMANSEINIKAFLSHGLGLMLICIFLVVCLRSYVGMTLHFPWKGEGHFALYLVIAVVCGKALGGILADIFGPLKVSCASLFLCALLFLFFRTPVCGILAIFIFNITMPITLGAIARILPNSLGFGFGILTFGLFIGLIPTLLSAQNILALPYGYSAACIVSAGLLYYGLKERAYAL